ncbi:Putative aldo-keto reductase 1 [Glycine soja]|uniref:Putative aldo-keto reductase 1 n=1 Tax=Glycine soja TaxID=3848 RepID=A0A0B2NXI8_GLYSO|nr:Putative aldo-keto reductase 1 [Glycine soja]
MEALTVKLSEKDPREISEAVPIGDVAGGRYYNGLDHFSWKFWLLVEEMVESCGK